MDYWKFVIQVISHATYDLNNKILVCYSSHGLNNELKPVSQMVWISVMAWIMIFLFKNFIIQPEKQPAG